jgi:excisionase family DNA binding protein
MVALIGPGDIAPAEAGRLGESLASADRIVVGGQSVVVPPAAREALAAMMEGLAAGDHVGIVRLPELLTTQEAADLLRVSRPTLVKLLDDGVIPSQRPGSHRRVTRAAVMEFAEGRAVRRKTGLDALAEVDGEFGVGVGSGCAAGVGRGRFFGGAGSAS